MTERRVIELLTRKWAGEATEEDLLELNQLKDICPEFDLYEELFNQLWNVKSDTEDMDSFYDRHKNKYQNELGILPEGKVVLINRHRRLFRIALGAACCLLLLAATYIFFQGRSISVPARNAQIIAGKGIRKSVVLPDGTKVWLNGDSRINYDDQMTQQPMREVQLTGEAFFDVAHDAHHPFIIHTNKISIRVLGTAFNVKAYPNEKECTTTLLRGSIELSLNKRPQQKFLLKPSEKFSMIEEENEEVRKNDAQAPDVTLSIQSVKPIKVDNQHYFLETSWKDNKLVFEDESFKELARKLERWYNVKIEIRDEKINDYKFTGVFTTETIEQALTAMKLIKSFNYKMNQNDIIIF